MSLAAYVIYALFFLSEILISRRRAQASDTQRADKNSLLVLWLVIVGSVSAAVVIAFNLYLPIAHSGSTQYAGLAFMVPGMVLRWSVVRALGRRFTADVAIRQGHTLKTDGIYHYLRHPSYAALLLIFLGLGLSLNNWASLALIVLNATGALLYRIHIEDATLAAHFGQPYREYKRRTKALIPFVY